MNLSKIVEKLSPSSYSYMTVLNNSSKCFNNTGYRFNLFVDGALKDYKIFVVDDEQVNTRLLEAILSDYNVDSASSSSELYDLLKEGIPDVILLDIMMPGSDGLSIAQNLKDDIKYRDIPIIFISSLDSGSTVAAGFECGGDDYIKKPFDSSELQARVKRVLKNRERSNELYQKATRDSLTGIYNREFFMEHLTMMLKKAKRENINFSLGIADIDHFKKVNDTWGHLAGDVTLKRFVDLLTNSLRDYDIIARYGGEEFIFLINGVTKEEALSIVKRTAELLAVTEIDKDKNIHITFSCGIADVTEAIGADNIGMCLLEIADRRLYAAKESGRNRIIID